MPRSKQPHPATTRAVENNQENNRKKEQKSEGQEEAGEDCAQFGIQQDAWRQRSRNAAPQGQKIP